MASSETLLHELFGFEAFRPGQQRAVEAALTGRDALVVMPTGAGKSLCYSIPGLATEELTIVVSPLQALMRDQVEALHARGHTSAFRLDSSLSAGEAMATLSAVADGSCRLVFVAPERFADARFRDAVEGRPVDLFAVDEAHCLSDWGHDFRPDYLRLADARDDVAARCTMALTATATHRVALDIARAMRLRDPVDVATGFDRPSLTFDVIPARTEAAKWRILRAGLADPETRPALVYAGTRRRCEELAGQLRAEGIRASAYHAGLPDAERAAVQSGFMAGDPDVVVATTAFGMGVDKADVRAVWHWALPESLEAYYQEAGRAGRDGQQARCVLLYAASDRGLIGRRIAERAVDAGDVNGLLAQLTRSAAADGAFGVSLDALGERGKTLLAVAERIGALELWPGRGGQAAGRLRLRAIGRNRSADVENASRSALRIRWEALAAITGYATEHRCRRLQLLRHFGDPAEPHPAGRCCDVHEPPADLIASQTPDAAALRALAVEGALLASPAVGRSGLDAILRGSARARQSHPEHPLLGRASDVLQADVLAAIEAAVAAGELARSGGARPVLRVPGAAMAPPAAGERPALASGPLADRLRDWRTRRADGKPAYTVINDRTLAAIVELLPASEEELLRVDGIGPGKLERYGDELLELVREHAGRPAHAVEA
jgi:RecQ family ATP-dependent DNA helicase